LQGYREYAIGEKIESNANLSLDVSARRNSTYKMHSIVFVYEHAFTRYNKSDPYYNVDLPKDDEAIRLSNSND